MTREDIIKMAREAGLYVGRNISGVQLVGSSYEPGGLLVHLTVEEFERFAALAVAAEREACAAVCCDMIDAEYKTGKVDHNEMAWTQACANAIRARGEQ